MGLIELLFREFGDGMQEVRSSILLISTIRIGLLHEVFRHHAIILFLVFGLKFEEKIVILQLSTLHCIIKGLQ